MSFKSIGELIEDVSNAGSVVGHVADFKKLSKAQQEVVLSSNKLDASLKGDLAKAVGNTADVATAADSVAGLGQAFKGAALSAKNFASALLLNPVTWIVAAIGASAIAVYNQSVAFDKAKEKALESQDAYRSTAQDLTTLNSELDTTTTRIQELQTLKDAGTITLTEEAELSKLQRQNAELERTIELKKQEEKVAQRQAVSDAMDALTIDTVKPKSSSYSTLMTTQPGSSNISKTDKISAAEQDIEYLTQLKSEYDKLYSEWQSAPDDSKQKSKLSDNLKKKQAEIDDYTSSISASITELSELRNSFLDESGMPLSDLSGDQLAMLDNLNIVKPPNRDLHRLHPAV